MVGIVRAAGFATALLVAAALPLHAQADVAGNWLLTVQGPEGPGEVVAVFTQDGSTVTGALEVPMVGAAEMSDGVIDDDKLTFLVHVDVEGQWYTVEVVATVADDTMEGSFYLAEFGSMPFTGRRTDRPTD